MCACLWQRGIPLVFLPTSVSCMDLACLSTVGICACVHMYVNFLSCCEIMRQCLDHQAKTHSCLVAQL